MSVSHVTHINFDTHKLATCLCVTWMSLVWHDSPRLIHVTHRHVAHSMCDMNESFNVCEKSTCDMSCLRYVYVWHDSFTWVMFAICLCVTWLIHVCDMTHGYVWHDSFTCATWLTLNTGNFEKIVGSTILIYVRNVYVWQDSLTCATWLMSICDMTHLRVRRDSRRTPAILRRSSALPFSSTWEMSMCDKTPSRVRHDSCLYVTWLIYVCDMTHVYMWHDSFTCATWLMPNTCNFEKIVGPATLICTAVCPYRCCV